MRFKYKLSSQPNQIHFIEADSVEEVYKKLEEVSFMIYDIQQISEAE